MKQGLQPVVAIGALILVACTGPHAGTTGASTTRATSSSASGTSGSTTSTTVGSSSSGGSYGAGDDPDGGNAYPDGGFPPLSCYPPEGYQGNEYGVGAYCSSDSPTCQPLMKCGDQFGYNFCVTEGCSYYSDGGGSLSQCGPGACCIPYEGGATFCVPTGCVIDMLTDGGGCPDP